MSPAAPAAALVWPIWDFTEPRAMCCFCGLFSEKIKRVIGKVVDGAPHETILVLDASIGQNSLSQARLFNDMLDVDGLVMNPAGFTYRGEALRDCILDCEGLPYIEVHISNLAKRDIKSVLASAADGMLMGFGIQSYLLALDAMLDLLQKRNG